MMMWAASGPLWAVIMRGVALPIGLGIVWALGIENLVSAMATSMFSALEPPPNVLPAVIRGLAGRVDHSGATSARQRSGVSSTVGEARSLATLAAYVVGCALLTVWATRRRDVS